MVTLAQRLEALRTKKNISRVDLAAAMGMPRLSIEKFETGKLTPSKEQQEKLAAYFGVTVPYLRGESDDLVSMESWLSGNVPDEPEIQPVKKPKPKLSEVEKEENAMFNLLLRSESFKNAVLAVLKTPEGQKLVAEAARKGR